MSDLTDGSISLDSMGGGDSGGFDLGSLIGVSAADLAAPIGSMNFNQDFANLIGIDTSAPWMPSASNPNLEAGATPAQRRNQTLAAYAASLLNPVADTAATNLYGADTTGFNTQNLGVTDANMAEFQTNLADIFNNQKGYTSQWQNVGDNKIMVQDDGTAIGVNQTSGQSFSLPADTVSNMIASGQLNTMASGYNTATGGNSIAPGGGSTVITKDGTKITTMSDGTKIITDTNGGTKVIDPNGNTKVINPGGKVTTDNKSTGMDPTTLLALLAGISALAGKSGGSTGASSMGIPTLKATRTQTNVAPPKAGEKNVNYFNPVTYAAGGGLMDGGISSLGHYSDGGQLLKGPGDGVSDSIPAIIGGKQKAALANNEFVIPARIVSEIGNGSTDAGAKKLYAMMDRVQNARKKSIGKNKLAVDSRAYKELDKL